MMSQSEDRKASFDQVPTYFYFQPEEPASPRHRGEQLVRKRNNPARYQRGEDNRFGSFNNHHASLYIPKFGHCRLGYVILCYQENMCQK